METERRRILEMLGEGRITADQANDLLQALEATREPHAEPHTDAVRDPSAPSHPQDWARLGRDLAREVQTHVTAALSGLGKHVGAATRDAAKATRAAARTGPASEALLTAYTMEDDGQSIDIKCHAGNLALVGVAGETFRLVARRPLRLGETAPSGWEKTFHWSADRDGGNHTFILGDAQEPQATQNMTFRFEIPIQASVTASTEGGDITAQSLAGNLDLNTAGGEIATTDIEGSVNANTGGGDITSEHVKGPVRANTGGGDIRAREVEGEFNANTGGGDITVSGVEGNTRVNTGGGDITATGIEGELHANTGGGDIAASEVEGKASVSTGGGDIAVRKIGGPVVATTGGGDAAASEIEGDLSIETGGGAVSVSQVEGSDTAKSHGGDMTVSDVEGDVRAEAEGGSTTLSNISGSVNTGE